MNKSKVFICFSAIISLAMSYISTSEYFFYSPYTEDTGMASTILGQLVHVISRLDSMPAINFILMTIFLLNSVSIFLCLLKIDTRVETKKYFSLMCMLLLIMGLALFVIDISTYIIDYDMLSFFENFTLKFKILKWIPQILIFSIPTFYLLGVQTYMIKKVNSVKLNKKSVILSIYIASILFLTLITFCEFSEVLDKFLNHFKLRTLIIIFGEHAYFVGEANIEYYIYYVLALTLFFGAIYGVSELISRKNRKKQIN